MILIGEKLVGMGLDNVAWSTAGKFYVVSFACSWRAVEVIQYMHEQNYELVSSHTRMDYVSKCPVEVTEFVFKGNV